jgi:hypothetical protein
MMTASIADADLTDMWPTPGPELDPGNLRQAILDRNFDQFCFLFFLFIYFFNSFSASPEQLLLMAFYQFEHFGLLTKFNIPPNKFRNFLVAIYNSYYDNPYHNFVHGWVVLHSSFLFIEETCLKNQLKSLEILGTLVGSLGHDVAHPGTNNQFHINSMSDLALLYNDQVSFLDFAVSFLFKNRPFSKTTTQPALSVFSWTQQTPGLTPCLLERSVSCAKS